MFAQAERLIRLGLADAAVVGGVDTLCGSVLFGFNSLELVSPEPCRPFDVERRGISLGEAAGFALLERAKRRRAGAALLGYGESSDAHHMSTPHPEGLGARAGAATTRSRAPASTPRDIDYINLHGTASQKNDEVEARARRATCFPATTHASSTKGWTGHTLGAAGIVEAVISAARARARPACRARSTRRRSIRPAARRSASTTRRGRVRVALSNSFGFGGSNCVLVFGDATAA